MSVPLGGVAVMIGICLIIKWSLECVKHYLGVKREEKRDAERETIYGWAVSLQRDDEMLSGGEWWRL